VSSGAKFAVILSSGFSEARDGSGATRQEELNRIVAKGVTRVLGPNAEGFFNVLGDIPVSFAPATSYKLGLQPITVGPLAIVAQSGGVGFGLFSAAQRRLLGTSYVVTTGNEVDVDANDVLEYLISDDHTKSIAMFVEGLNNGTRFLELARGALDVGKPILMTKVGTSPAGKRAAQSHTAHMAGDQFVFDSAMESVGVIQCRDVDDVLDLTDTFANCPSPKGNRVVVLTLSGGAGAWAADACHAEDLELPALSAEGRAKLATLSGEFGSFANPVDVTGMGVQSDGLAGVLEIVLAEDEADAVIMVIPLASNRLLLRDLERIDRAIKDSGKSVVIYSYSPPSDESIATVRELGVPLFTSPIRAARSLAVVARYAQLRATRGDTVVPVEDDRRPVPAFVDGVLAEHVAKAFLFERGVRVTRERLATTADEAAVAGREIGFPVVAKVQSAKLSHKSDVGGVIVGLASEDELRDAFSKLCAIGREAVGGEIDGILVQEMISGGLEVIVGSLVDPLFGPIIMVGTGGIYAETLNDRVAAPAPVTPRQARDLVERLGSFPVLTGSRGRPALDVDALSDIVSRISVMATQYRDRIGEIEVNPVMVLPVGQGAIAVDALIGAIGSEQ
jgi:acetyltransferase